MTFSNPERPEEETSPQSLGESASPATPEELQPRFTVRLPQRKPFVVYSILGLTILLYVLQQLSEQGLYVQSALHCSYYIDYIATRFFPPDLFSCYGVKVNEFILSGQYWRLISPILLHGSFLHVGFNMYALYVLGPELERHFGHWQFFLLYLTSGFAGFVVSFRLTPSPALGASTAVFGLLAAQGVFIYRNQRIFGPRARTVLGNLISLAAINLMIGLSPGIDNWGHVGGLLGGLLFTWIAAPDYRVAGDGPEYELENETRESATVLAALVTTGLFAILAAVPIVRLALA